MNEIAYSQQKMRAGYWCKAETGRGVVMLVHGLNHSAFSWQDLIAELNNRGLHVFVVCLTGHRRNSLEEFKEVSSDIWLRDFQRGYEHIATSYASLPVSLVAFSLGGLLAVVVQLQQQAPVFSGQILLAPALALKPYTRLAPLLCRIFPLLPSMVPREYLANPQGITAKAYQTLFALESRLKNVDEMQKLNIPTRVLMRKNDEIINYSGVCEFLEKYRLSNWQMVEIPSKRRKLFSLTCNHLMIDKSTMGMRGWQLMADTIERVLARED